MISLPTAVPLDGLHHDLPVALQLLGRAVISLYIYIYIHMYISSFFLPHAVSASATAVHRDSLCGPASTREVKRWGGGCVL